MGYRLFGCQGIQWKCLWREEGRLPKKGCLSPGKEAEFSPREELPGPVLVRSLSVVLYCGELTFRYVTQSGPLLSET